MSEQLNKEELQEWIAPKLIQLDADNNTLVDAGPNDDGLTHGTS